MPIIELFLFVIEYNINSINRKAVFKQTIKIKP